MLFNLLPSVNCAILFFLVCATVPSFRKELVTCRKERPLSEETELNALHTTDHTQIYWEVLGGVPASQQSQVHESNV